MPAAVKLLKSLPFFGAPFASFAYGMAHKTGKTVLYNPAVFNNIQNAKHEFAGTQSPAEKELIAKFPQYQYYGENSMFKLPFFQNYPLYLNTKNFIPYYTVSFLDPSNRKIDSSLPGVVTQVIDKLPVMKDPMGQTIMDMFIIPMLMNEAVPQGIFGQPLYPLDASPTEKVLYTARNMTEPYVPTFLGLGGLAVPDKIIPGTETSIIDTIPLARARGVAYAKEGKNAYGITGREGEASRTIRQLAAGLGFPIAPPIDESQAK
jgi:hypothetical protein